MVNTTKSKPTATRKSTAKTATKKAGTKTAKKPELVAASSAKALDGTIGKAKAATTKLRDLLVKSWPKFPSVEDLMKAVPGTAKSRILMYRGAVDRTMKAAQRVGRLAK